MKGRIYAVHDDAESLVGDPCIMDDGHCGQIIAVAENEEYSASNGADNDANPLMVFIIYDWNIDDCCTAAAITPIMHVYKTMAQNTANRTGIALVMAELENRLKKDADKIGINWHNTDPRHDARSWAKVAMLLLERYPDDKDKLIDAIFSLIFAYNLLLVKENK